jgi:hypothetical protein
VARLLQRLITSRRRIPVNAEATDTTDTVTDAEAVTVRGPRQSLTLQQ